nr:hypothetical protein [uncultured Holophaga sp.]
MTDRMHPQDLRAHLAVEFYHDTNHDRDAMARAIESADELLDALERTPVPNHIPDAGEMVAKLEQTERELNDYKLALSQTEGELSKAEARVKELENERHHFKEAGAKATEQCVQEATATLRARLAAYEAAGSVKGCDKCILQLKTMPDLISERNAAISRADAAEAERDRLREELEKKSSADTAVWCPEHAHLMDYEGHCPECEIRSVRAAAHQEGAEKERERLKPWARHDEGCGALTMLLKTQPTESACTCGLREALEGGNHE